MLKVHREMFGRIQSVFPEIEDAMGDKICCKILYFLGDRTPNSISVMLECVPKDSIENITILRRSMGYELVRKCLSPDFFLPVNQRIRVHVAGNFALSKHIKKSYYFLTLFPPRLDNFICFPVDRNAVIGCDVYGIISFIEDNGRKKDLHTIHHDPWSSRGKPQRYPRIISGSREMEAAADDRSDRSDTNCDESMYNNFVSKELAINITHFNIKNIKESN